MNIILHLPHRVTLHQHIIWCLRMYFKVYIYIYIYNLKILIGSVNFLITSDVTGSDRYLKRIRTGILNYSIGAIFSSSKISEIQKSNPDPNRLSECLDLRPRHTIFDNLLYRLQLKETLHILGLGLIPSNKKALVG